MGLGFRVLGKGETARARERERARVKVALATARASGQLLRTNCSGPSHFKGLPLYRSNYRAIKVALERE